MKTRHFAGLAIAGILIAMPLAIDTSQAVALPTATVPDYSTASTTADDVMAQARESGRRVEDLTQRTESDQVFANPDGTWTAESNAGPVRTRDADGQWADIDTSLEKVPGGYAPVNAIGDLTISDGGDKTFAAMTVDGKDVGWQWPATLPTPTVNGDSATYANVVDGGDLVVTATPSGFRHDIVLHRAPDRPVAFKVPVITDGPKVDEQADGELTVTTKGGDELVSAAPPIMYDAPSPGTSEPVHQAPVDTTVTSTPTGGVVTLDPDEAFLNSPSTTYPVTIDPTFESTNPTDTWIYDNGPDSIHPYDDTLYAGTPDAGTTRYRTFVKFNKGSWDGAVINSATLTLRNFYSADMGSDCLGGQVQVRRVADDWAPGSTTWNHQPTTATTNAVTNANALGYTGCPSGDVSWNVTGIVQDWANWAGNYGFRIAAYDETKSASFRKYRSAGYTYSSSWPRLTVTYNHYPSVSSSSVTVSPSRGSSTRSAMPTLSAVVSDPDLGTVTGEFQVYDSSGGLIWSTTQAVTSGSAASVQVPADILSFDSAYTLKVRASDGSLTSSYVTKAFTVDPMASVVPASACTSGCQAFADPVQLAAITLGPNESRLVDVGLPGVDPAVVDRVLMTAKATNWSAAGSITVSDPDYLDAEPPTLTYTSANSPATGVTTTVETYTSYDTNQIKVTNNGSTSVDVNLAAYGWFPAADQTADETAEATVDSSLVDPYNDDEDQVDDGTTVTLGPDRLAYFAAAAPVLTQSEQPVTSDVPCPSGSDPSSQCSVVVDPNATPSDSDLQTVQSAPDTAVVDSNTGAPITDDSASGSSATTSPTGQTYTAEQMVASTATAEPNCKGVMPKVWVLRDRYLACKDGFTTITNWKDGEVVGFAAMWVQQRIHLHWNSPTIDQDYREIYVRGWGTGSEVSNDHRLTCSPCDYDDGQPWRSTTPYAINAATPVTEWARNHREVTVSQDQIVNVTVGAEQRTFAGGALIPDDYRSSYGLIRCDRLYYLNAGAGCVFTHYIPVLKMYLSGTAPQTAKHILFAQMTKRLPGAKTQWGGSGGPLTRKFWFGATNRNRVVKDRMCKGLPRPTGYQCDEYPFASTNQGCYVICDVRMIPGDDNGRGGIILNNSLYRAKRVINGDAFWVRILP